MTEFDLRLTEQEIVKFLSKWAIWGPAEWHLIVDLDWRDLRSRRRNQMAYLARYGRQDVLRWADEPLTRVAEMYQAISDLVREENDTKKSEDH